VLYGISMKVALPSHENPHPRSTDGLEWGTRTFLV
jgi:hypothetical protein